MHIYGIKQRLIAAYGLLIMFSLALLGGYALWFFHQYNLDSLTGSLISQARLAAKIVEDHQSTESMSSLNNRIQLLGESISFRITVIDIDGVVLADSQYESAKLENHLSRPEIAAALTGRNGSDIHYNIRAQENWLYAAAPLIQNGEITGVVRVSTSLASVEAGFRRLAYALLSAFIITSLLGLFISSRLAKKYTAPLLTITSAAQAYSAGDLSARVYLHTEDESALLAQAFNKLARNLEEKIAEITAEKQKSELILENMDNAVLLLNSSGKVITANKMAGRLFSLTNDMLGQHHLQIVGSSALEKAVQHTIASRQPQTLTINSSNAKQKTVLAVFIAPIMESRGTAANILTVFHDITIWQELQNRQNGFIANASHELSTPLTAICGFTETLLDGALDDAKTSRHFVSIIDTEAHRMQHLVHDLLQLARISSTDYAGSLEITNIDAGMAIAAVLETMQPLAAKKGITLFWQSELSSGVSADMFWLKLILTNLLENAIKYTPAGGKVTISCSAAGKFATFTIADTGIGIPPGDLPRIFERFYRVDKARSRAAGGYGLGLSIVKSTAEMLGGTITADSRPGCGSTFTFTLPLAPAHS